MTERIDTPADLVATLATISESLSATAMPTLDNIEAQLLPLLNDAEARGDSQAITLIHGTYARAQELINVAQASRENAATAVDLAQTFRNQRDGIAEEYDELYEAVVEDDRDHPLVADLASIIEEEIYTYQESIAEFDGSVDRDDVLNDIRYHLNKLTGREKDEIDCLIEVLDGDHTPNADQVTMLQKLIDSLYANRPISDKVTYDPDPDGWNDEDLEDGDDNE